MSDVPPAEPDAGVTLAELLPMLTLFAQALCEQPVALREAGMGEPASTDDYGDARARSAHPHVPSARAHGDAGSRVRELVLPARVAHGATRHDNRAAYRIAILRQAQAPAAHDAAVATALRLASVLWRRLFRLLEALRIDSAIEHRYAGARADLERLRAQELAARANWPRQPTRRAVEALRRDARGQPHQSLLAEAALDGLQPLLALADRLRSTDAGAHDSARIASAITHALGGRPLRRGTVDADAAELLQAAAPRQPGGPDAASEFVAAPHAEHDRHGADALTEAAPPNFGGATGRSGAGALAQRTARSAAASPAPNAVDPSDASPAPTPHRATTSRTEADRERAARVFAIDEWDCHLQRMRPGWCSLIERRQHGDDAAFIVQARRRHAALVRAVHRRFAAWRPEGLVRVHGADDGDELEIERVIEAMVDRRAGFVHDQPLYLRRDRAQRDVATAFLVDTSASTDFVLPDGLVGPRRPAAAAPIDAVYLYDLSLGAPAAETPKRRVIDVAKDALALMCDALHGLGDAFAVYTFSGHGRAQVDFRVVKDFHEPVSARTAGALAALRPQGATRTGAAVRHASAQLARQPQRRRALIVVTDGYPEDIDYGPEPRELRYGVEDTAHALQEAQALGIATFCLSIDPAGHDYLRRMCAPERYLVIGDVAGLPEQLSKVYQAMTRPLPEATRVGPLRGRTPHFS